MPLQEKDLIKFTFFTQWWKQGGDILAPIPVMPCNCLTDIVEHSQALSISYGGRLFPGVRRKPEGVPALRLIIRPVLNANHHDCWAKICGDNLEWNQENNYWKSSGLAWNFTEVIACFSMRSWKNSLKQNHFRVTPSWRPQNCHSCFIVYSFLFLRLKLWIVGGTAHVQIDEEIWIHFRK